MSHKLVYGPKQPLLHRPPPRLMCGKKAVFGDGVLDENNANQSEAYIMQCATHTAAHDSHVGVNTLCSEFNTRRSPKGLVGG